MDGRRTERPEERLPWPVTLSVAAVLLLAYSAAAFLAYRLLVVVWASRPSPAVAIAAALAFVLVFGYLSHRVGTAHLLSSVDARELERERAPGIYDRLDALADRMDAPTPTLAVTRLHTPNAFALAGSGGVVVVDTSLFELLERAELEGVLAHELAHLSGRDSLTQAFAYSALGVVVGVVRLVTLPVSLGLRGAALAAAVLGRRAPSRTLAGRLLAALDGVLVLAVVAGTMVVRADSRRREFLADERAAEATGDPLALARALRKIEQNATGPWETPAPLYVRGEVGKLARLFETHPDTEERVERLVSKAGTRRRKSA